MFLASLSAVGIASLALVAVAVASAGPASADDAAYIAALDNAGLIDHDGRPYHCRPDGVCHGQFENNEAALHTGKWVCNEIKWNGRSRTSLIDWLSHGEGLMPSPYSAPIIVDAATKYLC